MKKSECQHCITLQEELSEKDKLIEELQRRVYEIESDDQDVPNSPDTQASTISRPRKTALHRKILKLSKSHDITKIMENELIYLGRDRDVICVCGRVTDNAFVYYNIQTYNIIYVGDKCMKKSNMDNINYDVVKFLDGFPYAYPLSAQIQKIKFDWLTKYQPGIIEDIVDYVRNSIVTRDGRHLKLSRKIIPFVIEVKSEYKKELDMLVDKILIIERQNRMDPLRTCTCDINVVCCCEDPFVEFVENVQQCQKCFRLICRGCDFDVGFLCE